jgi:UDP-2-acetamido-3-amino-2,3-dideoxy-glucuronate N-acetyltransferase
VVTGDIPDYALVQGNPARAQGWMSRHGHRLNHPDTDGIMTCPESGLRYQLVSETTAAPPHRPPSSGDPSTAHRPPSSGSPSSVLKCLDLNEESALPESLSNGRRSYDEYKQTTAMRPV